MKGIKEMIAVIPARGGSKGVPKKNIKMLKDKPLIAYTIEAAKESAVFDKIIVSTDSEEIADVAVKYGAEVPFIRPAEISGDAVSSDDVVIHALKYFEKLGMKYEEVCKLQPTSPLRNAQHIIQAYQLLKENGYNYVVSVCECEHSPLWSGILGKNGCMDAFLDEQYKRACRQQMGTYHRLNGAIYLGKTSVYLKDKSFLGAGCYAYVMSQEDSVDIDSLLDFQIAETIMKR